MLPFSACEYSVFPVVHLLKKFLFSYYVFLIPLLKTRSLAVCLFLALLLCSTVFQVCFYGNTMKLLLI